MTLEKNISSACIAIILAAVVTVTLAPARAAMNAPASVTLRAYHDPWPAGQERWWDISGNAIFSSPSPQPFDAFLDGTQTFNYQNDYPAGSRRITQVVLTYDKNPSPRYFVGNVKAKGLKPNFAYQLKLVGKPVYGARGMGKASSYVEVTSRLRDGKPVRRTVLDSSGNPTPVNGDDWSNQQLGYIGRWWNDTTQSAETNNPDYYYQLNYPANTIYGYQFMGVFVTDRYGRANVNFHGGFSYHITRAEWENPYLPSLRQDPRSPFTVVTSSAPPPVGYGYTTPSYYGYGYDFTSRSVRLYYEYEPGRTQPVMLPRGTYHCRFIITEESFHNSVWSTPDGGYWKSVLASEDFSYDPAGNLIGPDTNPANDIVFTIGDITPPTVTITAPAHGAVLTSSPTQTSGTASDNRSRILRVMVTLARFSRAGAANPAQYWNWRTGVFQRNRTVDTKRLASTTDNFAHWQKSGLPVLPPGLYGVQAKAMDGAGNLGSTSWSRFSVTTTGVTGSGARASSTTTEFSAAIAAVRDATIRLTFTNALDVNDATDPARYAVEINGRMAVVESVSYNAASNTVTLGLAAGALRSGDAVIAYWHNLRDARGAVLSGKTGSVTAR